MTFLAVYVVGRTSSMDLAHHVATAIGEDVFGSPWVACGIYLVMYSRHFFISSSLSH